MKVWENGSSFPWMELGRAQEKSPWDANGVLLRFGRDALGLLLNHGMKFRGWQRLWVPSYYCPEVIDYLINTGIEVRIYSKFILQGEQFLELSEVQKGDVILVINYFGLDVEKPLLLDQYENVEIIEDHSHDPWSSWAWNSRADWCIASIRKVIPIPDGAVLWSPKGYTIQESLHVIVERPIAALQKLSGMMLKRLYLEGESIDKNLYLHFIKLGEKEIENKEIVGITNLSKSIINNFPILRWREQKRKNYDQLISLLGDCQNISILKGAEQDLDTCPFSVVLVVDTSKRRKRIFDYLISQSIYPAILWQVGKIEMKAPIEDNIDFSNRMLAIHCDGRYNREDMLKISTKIHEFLNVESVENVVNQNSIKKPIYGNKCIMGQC